MRALLLLLCLSVAACAPSGGVDVTGAGSEAPVASPTQSPDADPRVGGTEPSSEDDVHRETGPRLLHVQHAFWYCSLDSLTRSSDVVATGVLEVEEGDVRAPWAADGTLDTSYRIAVDEVLLGEVGDDELVLASPSSSDGREILVNDTAPVLAGRSGLFFLRREEAHQPFLALNSPDGHFYFDDEEVLGSPRDHSVAADAEAMTRSQLLDRVREAAGGDPVEPGREVCGA